MQELKIAWAPVACQSFLIQLELVVKAWLWGLETNAGLSYVLLEGTDRLKWVGTLAATCQGCSHTCKELGGRP